MPFMMRQELNDQLTDPILAGIGLVNHVICMPNESTKPKVYKCVSVVVQFEVGSGFT